MKDRLKISKTIRGNLLLCILIILVVAAIAVWQNVKEKKRAPKEGHEVGERTLLSGEQVEGPTENAKKVAITFDDGPTPGCTDRLLDGLKERGALATFFVIGEKAKQSPDLIKREEKEGHLIGNHTYSHVQLTAISMEAARREILDTQQVIGKAAGEEPEYMRPPFGAWQKELEEELGLMPVLWTVDPLDWTTSNVDEIVKKVVTEVEENDIILLHDCYASSVDAALRIVDLLSEEGYEFVTVDALILD